MSAAYNRLSINAITSISGGWNLLMRSYWQYFAVTSIMLVAACCIPAGGLMVPFLTAGIYAMAFRAMRGEPYDISTAFGSGYKGKSWRIFFAALVSGLPWAPLTIMAQFTEKIEKAPQETINLFLLAALVFFAIAILWSITCVFWIALIVDKDLGFAEAFFLSATAAWMNLPGLLLLYIATGILLTAGAFAFCIGVLFVYPLMMLAFAVAYRQVFPDDSPRGFQHQPPPPGSYAASFGQGI
jgi:hypothetical protein